MRNISIQTKQVKLVFHVKFSGKQINFECEYLRKNNILFVLFKLTFRTTIETKKRYLLQTHALKYFAFKIELFYWKHYTAATILKKIHFLKYNF